MILYLTLALLALANGSPSYTPFEFDEAKVGRIVGGQKISIEQVPYQVSVTMFGIHTCGGAIIGPEHVVTAAHCVDIVPIRRLQVNAGSSNSRYKESIHKVIDVMIHDNFTIIPPGIPKNDIAVLKVSPSFKYSETIHPIKLSFRQIRDNQLITVSGYGAIKERGRVSHILRGITVPVFNKSQCNKSYQRVDVPVGDEFFCAGFKSGVKDACQGDSGGPAASNGKLVGIVSYGEGCARPNLPGIYTDVAYFKNWLKSVVR